MKLGLGTVQFGLNYGISNHHGIPSADEIVRILRLAEERGIRYLDTAAEYGRSEETLGEQINAGGFSDFRVVTKTPKAASVDSERNAREFHTTFMRSLERLRLNAVYGLLIHRAEDLISGGSRLKVKRWALGSLGRPTTTPSTFARNSHITARMAPS